MPERGGSGSFEKGKMKEKGLKIRRGRKRIMKKNRAGKNSLGEGARATKTRRNSGEESQKTVEAQGK